MIEGSLIAILTLFVGFCIIYMIKHRDDLSAFAFFVLYIYMIFALVGYAFFPELLELAGTYYGVEMFYYYWGFMFLSFLFTFIVYKKVSPRYLSGRIIYVLKPNRGRSKLFFAFLIILYIWINFYFHYNRSSFGWGQERPMGDGYFVLSFRYFQSATLILYALLRIHFSKFKLILFSFCFVLYLQVDVAAGARSDILYGFIAILLFELYPLVNTIKKDKKKLILMLIAGGGLIQVLLILLSIRSAGSISFSDIAAASNDENDVPFVEKLLLQDYFSPSQTLLLAMHYNFINPIEVFLSNFWNIIIASKYPYLTSEIVGLINGSLSRHEGWGFHFFVEGYCFMGILGFIYNGVVWNFVMKLFHMFTQTNNTSFKRAMIMICASSIVSMMRSQSSQSYQNFIFSLLPAIILLAFAFDYRICMIKRNK